MPRNTSLTAGGRYQTEIFLGERFGRSGLRLVAASQFNRQLRISARYNYGQKIHYVASLYQGRGSDGLLSLTFLPQEKVRFQLSLTYSDFYRSGDGIKEYDYTILRSASTYQVNKYLFFRAILEYNSLKQDLTNLLTVFWRPREAFFSKYLIYGGCEPGQKALWPGTILYITDAREKKSFSSSCLILMKSEKFGRGKSDPGI